MEREILFRAKSLESKRWIYGSYCYYKDYRDIEQHLIYSRNNGNSEWVDKNTLGQYTGLKDKNGIKIFEGDVVSLLKEDKEKGGQKEFAKCQIVYMEDCFCCKSSNTEYSLMPCVRYKFIEVIGNIYDNKELIERA